MVILVVILCLLFLFSESKLNKKKIKTGPMTVKLEVYNGTVPSLVSTTYSWTKVYLKVLYIFKREKMPSDLRVN